MTNTDLATMVLRFGRQHAPRTPERRAAGMAFAALSTTKTPGAAHRALSTFGDPFTRAAAALLLDELQREAA
jgi:hypothetical protein